MHAWPMQAEPEISGAPNNNVSVIHGMHKRKPESVPKIYQ